MVVASWCPLMWMSNAWLRGFLWPCILRACSSSLYIWSLWQSNWIYSFVSFTGQLWALKMTKEAAIFSWCWDVYWTNLSCATSYWFKWMLSQMSFKSPSTQMEMLKGTNMSECVNTLWITKCACVTVTLASSSSKNRKAGTGVMVQ